MTKPILPGATLGMLGSGQLGRMFAIAARRLGYRVHVYSPGKDTPCGHVADREFTGAYDDEESLAEFARSVDVVTLEFENVHRRSVEAVERFVPVRPSASVLHTSQHRLREKTALRDAGFPTADFAEIRSAGDVDSVNDRLLPGVLKTAAFGYDGKGQRMVSSRADLQAAWTELNQQCVLEQLVDFRCELSVVAARGLSGEIVTYEPFENDHADHILDVTLCPGRFSDAVRSQAQEIARGVLESLDVVGVMCVEMFLTSDDRLLINEVAPRPHNSGHLTIDAHVTCQFEQQVRAVCGLPLGSTEQLRPAAMANLLGNLWSSGEPDWLTVLAEPSVKLHLYGKQSARTGRKMGHLTACGATAEAAGELLRQVRSRLSTD